MFASPSSSPTKKDLEDVGLSCEICMEAYSTPPSLKIPKALHCLHTFCLACCRKIQKPAADGSAGVQIECPSCRNVTRLDGMDSLLNNFALLRVLDMIALNHAVEPSDGEDSPACEQCTAAATASHYCAECGEYLCTDCAGFHQRMRATAGHDVKCLAQLKAEGGFSALRGRRIMCKKHVREELKLWCETCQELICRDCTIVDHPRPEHHYVFADSAGDEHKKKMTLELEDVKASVKSAQSAVRVLERNQEEAKSRDRRSMDALENRFAALRSALQQRESELKQEGEAFISAKQNALLAQIQLLRIYIRNAESCAAFVEHAADGASAYQFLAARGQMAARLAEIREEQRALCVLPPSDDALSFAQDHDVLLDAIQACCSRQRCALAAVVQVPRSLADSSDEDVEAPPPRAGVQYGQSLQGLLQEGWQVQYHQPYSHATSLSDLDPGRGEWLLVAARKRGQDALLLCAAARREEVLRRTEGATDAHESNGAYWYCWEGKAFGFAGSLHVTLSAADTERTLPETRLSWHINGGAGWRAGRETRLGEDVSTDAFEKMLFFRT